MSLREDKRRNIQRKLEFALSGPGQAQGAVEGGAESSQTAHESESPASTVTGRRMLA